MASIHGTREGYKKHWKDHTKPCTPCAAFMEGIYKSKPAPLPKVQKTSPRVDTRVKPFVLAKEPVLVAGMEAYKAMGKRLEEVRDERLYRKTHVTFNEWAQDLWGLSPAEAYWMIEHSQET